VCRCVYWKFCNHLMRFQAKYNFDTDHKVIEHFYKMTTAMSSVRPQPSNPYICVHNIVCKKCKDSESEAAFQLCIYLSVVLRLGVIFQVKPVLIFKNITDNRNAHSECDVIFTHLKFFLCAACRKLHVGWATQGFTREWVSSKSLSERPHPYENCHQSFGQVSSKWWESLWVLQYNIQEIQTQHTCIISKPLNHYN
jgi:hypothetical protein